MTPPSPITTGFLYLEIWSPEGVVKSGSPYGITELKEVSIKPNVDGNGDIKGEFHTVERTENPASKVDKVKEVYTGDNLSDAYTGVIYQEDKETPTYVWGRKYGIFLEKKPICRIMAEDTLRMNAKTARIFSGDIYGFFDYLSVIKINGLKGVYLPIKYIYNTKENIISAEFKQMFGDELHDVEYELTYDYGNSVKPTIRG